MFTSHVGLRIYASYESLSISEKGTFLLFRIDQLFLSAESNFVGSLRLISYDRTRSTMTLGEPLIEMTDYLVSEKFIL